MCVRVCVAWRGGRPGGRMDGEGLSVVRCPLSSGFGGLLGGGDFRGTFPRAGTTGKCSPRRDLTYGGAQPHFYCYLLGFEHFGAQK